MIVSLNYKLRYGLHCLNLLRRPVTQSVRCTIIITCFAHSDTPTPYTNLVHKVGLVIHIISLSSFTKYFSNYNIIINI